MSADYKQEGGMVEGVLHMSVIILYGSLVITTLNMYNIVDVTAETTLSLAHIDSHNKAKMS